jgi:hypothetical protein
VNEIMTPRAGGILLAVPPPFQGCRVREPVEHDLPNIVWITAEDMSANVGGCGDDYDTTPNIDRFVEQGIRYDNAFATAASKSSPRSTPSRRRAASAPSVLRRRPLAGRIDRRREQVDAYRLDSPMSHYP